MDSTLTVRFEDENHASAASGLNPLDEIGAIFTGRAASILRRIREKCWTNFEKAQEKLEETAEKLQLDDLSPGESLELTCKLTQVVEQQARIFDLLAMTKELTGIGVRKLDQSGSTNDPRSVNRSSRRTKPPIIVDGELT